MDLTYDAIARRIDHSLLAPTLTPAELEAGCQLALAYGVASVCIKPFAIGLARGILAGSNVAVGTVIGFPHGSNTTATKVFEAKAAMAEGATELDMVVNIGQALGGDWDAVRADIAAVTEAAHAQGAIVKVIFENCYLGALEKTRLCDICVEVGADFVKTSTGYGTGGATVEDLTLMRDRIAGSKTQLKAAGGCRDLETTIAFTKLGCERIGLSKTADILDALRERLGLPAIHTGSRQTASVSTSAY
jgi:deoxyribose-phosphate aldolase